MDKILERAKEIFGESRFEEIMGELWLQRAALERRARRGSLDVVLREWENRFRRDVEEGRYCVNKNQRRRVARFSELPDEADATEHGGATIEDLITPHVRRRF